MKQKFIIIAIVVIALVSLTIGCSSENDSNADDVKVSTPTVKVQVMLDWVPNTNHTGIYVAKEKGWYKEQGIDLEIIQPAESTAAQVVAAGKAQFGISYQEEVTYARASEIPIVSIAAIIQHNTSGFASPKEKNITSPTDFEGKKYGGWGSPVELAMVESIMKKENADVSKVEFINAGAADFFSVTKDDVDFEWIYYGWTGVEAELREFPLNYIAVNEIAPELDFYTPVIVTSEELIKENPDLIKKFMEATAMGYEFAISNPAEAAEILIAQVPGINADLVKKSQEWLADKYQDDAKQWGFQKDSVWETYANWMADYQLVPAMIEPKAAFTNEFLPKR